MPTARKIDHLVAKRIDLDRHEGNTDYLERLTDPLELLGAPIGKDEDYRFLIRTHEDVYYRGFYAAHQLGRVAGGQGLAWNKLINAFTAYAVRVLEGTDHAESVTIGDVINQALDWEQASKLRGAKGRQRGRRAATD